MVQRIRGQLKELHEIYSELMELALEKQPVLQANKDYDAVRGFTERETALITRAVRVEWERMQAVKELAQSWGAEAESLTVYEIARRAGEPEGAALTAEARTLLDTLQRLQRQNRMNRQLIEMNLSFAAFMLDTLVREQSPSSIYGASGGELEEEHRRLILDSEI